MTHDSPSPCAFLVIRNVPADHWSGPITSHRQVLGRADSNGLRIPSNYSSVSRKHAQVWANERGIWICDLGSRGGTRVNGIPLRPQEEHQLAIGDRLWLAGLELDLLHELPGPRETPPGMLSSEDTSWALEAQKQTMEFPARFDQFRLTRAERDVILWMSRGYSSLEELGQKLYRSPNTIRTQLGSIYQKLDVHTRDEVIAWFRRQPFDPPR